MSNQIEILKTFKVSAESVFDAWLDPNSIKNWMCPMPGVTVPNPQVDATVGGEFTFDMEVGGNILPHFGKYNIIDRSSKIQFTWNSMNTDNKDSLVTITIKATGEKECELVLIHELLPSEESIKNHTTGWTNIFGCLEEAIVR
jgi:uncharacterized protein YndB with AHSA1/START domain